MSAAATSRRQRVPPTAAAQDDTIMPGCLFKRGKPLPVEGQHATAVTARAALGKHGATPSCRSMAMARCRIWIRRRSPSVFKFDTTVAPQWSPVGVVADRLCHRRVSTFDKKCFFSAQTGTHKRAQLLRQKEAGNLFSS
jgi:hypothetical protein